MPYCCLIIGEISGVHNRPQLLDHPELATAASLLFGLSPLANGLLYATKSQSLRRAVQSYWRKKMTSSEFRQEIHARATSAAELGSGTGSSTSNIPLLQAFSEDMVTAGPARTELQPAGSYGTVDIPMFKSGW
ncbi:uncharacterized protein LOC143363567 [Halictus rubicundus]|uniref:uncharacterized protein LOC143363567 n=1 Tax=Halictus rubicundus TaxID=77578 RepID=UPI004036F1E8